MSGLSRVEPSAEEGVAATSSRLALVSCVRSMNSSLMMPRTPCSAPYTRVTCGKRCASSTTPTIDWLITAVGPPPCATRIFPDGMRSSLKVSKQPSAYRKSPQPLRLADIPVQELLDPAPEIDAVFRHAPAVAFLVIHDPFDVRVRALDRRIEVLAMVERHTLVGAAIGQKQRLRNAR